MTTEGLVLTTLLVLVSYLVGAVPFGYLVARWRGVDILHQGSGNIGATNVGRVLGKRLGVVVFVLDFAKGAGPAAAGTWLSQQPGCEDLPRGALAVASGLAAFLGHVFPIYLRFHGGKGVATGAGVVSVLLPGPAVGAFLTWLVVVVHSRYISLASLLGAFSLCVFRLFSPAPFSLDARILTVFCLVAAGLVLLRHRGNVARLLQGNENRLPDSPTMRQLAKVLHLLSLGLWFGSSVFFSFVVALLLFRTFEALGASPAERPPWLPVAVDFDKEKGTRLAGIAISPMFTWYFLLQGACALVATATALRWAQSGLREHRMRFLVLLLALATVVVGWPVAQKVNELRLARYDLDSQLAEQARAAFAEWHLISLLLNMVTVLLVTMAMILAAWLPGVESQPIGKPIGD
jgi:glycerol-3-phosphate acyltransferase PlsY